MSSQIAITNNDNDIMDIIPVIYKYNRVKPDIENQISDSENECSICFNLMSDNTNIKSLQCSHRFCKGCINKWEQLNATCPMCRTPIRHNKPITPHSIIININIQNNNYCSYLTSLTTQQKLCIIYCIIICILLILCIYTSIKK
jgi:hypothetical protein